MPYITFNQLYFLVEGDGPVMQAIKAWLEKKSEVQKATLALVRSIPGAEHYRHDEHGRLFCVRFDGDIAPGWKMPNKHGNSFPRKNSEWAKKLASQGDGHPTMTQALYPVVNAPCQINFTTKEGGRGFEAIGQFTNPIQLAAIGMEPPYCLVIPDAAPHIAEHEARGHIIAPEIKAFKAEFEGCRPIHLDEWKMLELQEKIARQKRNIADKKEGAL